MLQGLHNVPNPTVTSHRTGLKHCPVVPDSQGAEPCPGWRTGWALLLRTAAGDFTTYLAGGMPSSVMTVTRRWRLAS